MPKFCRECGSPLKEGARFCPNCGTQIVGATTAQNTNTQQQSYQQQNFQQAQPQQPYQQPKQPQSQQPQQVYEDAYADEKAQGVDWKQLKPKITIGKPQVTFISKRKLIVIGIVVVIVLLLALFSK